jgi:hypothetical protein
MANGLVNYGIIKPELATSFAQGFQQAQTEDLRRKVLEQEMAGREVTQQFNKEKLAQLRQDREAMVKLQQDLVSRGQNPDLDFVFDTMIKSGIPDYVTKGIEGKRRLEDQKQYARIMGFDSGAPAPAPAAPNALAGAMPPPPPPAAGPGMTPTPVTPMPAAPAAAPTPARNALAPADESARLTQQINGLLAMGTPQSVQAAQVLQSRLTSLQKAPTFMNVPEKGFVFDPATRTFITPPRVAGGAGEMEPPKLKQGERWNPTLQRVEAVEGSDIFKKQKSAFTQDYKTATSVTDKMDEGIKKINEILDPKNVGGFEGNFGGYNAFASQMLPGENTDMRKKIDSFKSTLKSAGLELIRAGGAIGQMTVQEWPIVEQMIDAISPALSEDQARNAFNEIRARFQRIADRAKDVYDTEYSDSQFYKPIRSMVGGGGGAAAPTAGATPRLSGEDQQALNWANSNPNDPRSAQIKQRLGVR